MKEQIERRLKELNDELMREINHNKIKEIEDEINELELRKWYLDKNK